MKKEYEHQCCECGKSFMLKVKPKRSKLRTCDTCKNRKRFQAIYSQKFRNCRWCGESKIIKDFNPRSRICNECLSLYMEEADQKLAMGLKFCNRCREWKSKDSLFFREKSSNDGYSNYCKACVMLSQQKHKKRNAEYSRRWQKNNPEKQSAISRRWYQENKGKKKAVVKRRIQKGKQLPNDFTNQDWQYALDYFNGCCAVCGRQMNDMFGEFKPAADHWIPLSYEDGDNPGTVPENIIPLCHGVGGCNNSKHNKLPSTWLEEKFGKRKAAEILKRIETFFSTVRKTQ